MRGKITSTHLQSQISIFSMIGWLLIIGLLRVEAWWYPGILCSYVLKESPGKYLPTIEFCSIAL